MRRRRFVLVLFVLLAFGVSLVVPAEDVPETAYDESEALPYEGAPVFSIVAPLGAARTTQAVPNSLSLKPSVLFPFGPAGVRYADANRSADTRISLSLLCTLLC
jgi:di/tricarboxylate transporter